LKQTYQCEILSKTELVKDTFDCTVKFPAPASAGQFVHVLCGDGVLLRRPFGVCDSGEGRLRFVFNVRGEGTRLLAGKQVGDVLNILGPLGMGFHPEKRGDGTSVVVGGGIGIFPLVKAAKELGGDTESILGFRTKDLIILQAEFEQICTHTHITTDDGTYGHHGFVTDILTRRIEETNITSVYACGPIPMLRLVKNIAAAHGIHCEISMEERMGCGIGACAVCVCRSKGQNVKICQTGPVFDAREVDI
jgi:dihydroorotate dehydrogenase electron transfer subunit